VSVAARPDGRKTAARAYDAMIAAIAAIAVAHDLPVYTCNPSDFSGIDELQVVAMAEHGDA
jgi:tRNA(fMet)-specific endonuclease VapC